MQWGTSTSGRKGFESFDGSEQTTYNLLSRLQAEPSLLFWLLTHTATTWQKEMHLHSTPADLLDSASSPTLKREIFCRFTLRGFMLWFTLFCMWLGWLKALPHVAVFLVGPFLVLATLALTIRLKHSISRLSWCLCTSMLTLFALTVLYLVSIGPAAAIYTYDIFPEQFVRRVYSPVVWTYSNTQIYYLIGSYVDDWMVHWGSSTSIEQWQNGLRPSPYGQFMR